MRRLPAFCLTALLVLAGCMPPPAQRERAGAVSDPRQACLAACNRAADVCYDQRAARDNAATTMPQTHGMAAICDRELRACLQRCGTAP